MPRSTLTDPNEIVSAVLFGNRLNRVNLSELEKRTGISKSTLADYKKNPSTIPLNRLARIVSVRGLTDEQIGKVLRAYKGR